MQEPRLRFKGFDDTWKESTLKNLGTIKAGGDVQKSKLKDKGKYPVLANGLNNDGIIGYYDNYKIDSPSVTITGRGTIGTAKARKYKYTPVVRLLSFKTDLNIYFTENAINNINILNESTGVPQLTSVQLGKYRIMYTSLLEQNKIGQFFNHFDKLIELQSSKLDHLKHLKKGYLQKMFPSDEDNIPRLRFEEFSNKWKNEKLKNIAERDDNSRVPITRSKRQEGEIPYYGANGIQDYVNGYTHDGHYALIAEDGANSISDYPIHNVKGKIWVNNHAHVLNGKDGLLDTNFLVSEMKTINLEKYLTGNGRYKLNSNVMMNIQIKVPSIPEQTKIGQFFTQLDQLIELQTSKLEHLKKIKKAYLQKMFI